MRFNRTSKLGDQRHAHRKGLLYLGAAPEITVITMAVCVCLVVVSQANSMLNWSHSSQSPRLSDRFEHPILSLDYDPGQQRLLIHSWRSEFEEIDLQSGATKKCRKPEHMVSAASSTQNSTTAFLSEWARKGELRHDICVIRNDELLLLEELDFGVLTSGELRISADGSVVIAATHDGRYFGFDLTTPEPTRWRFRIEKSTFTTQLSPDGRLIFVALGDGGCVICDARRGTVEKVLPSLGDCARSVTWSSDGRRIAVGDQGGNVTVFDAASGERVWQQKIEMLFARSLALSSDGTMLAVGGFDKRIWLWDLARQAAPPQTLDGESSVVHDLVFVAGDSRLISGSQDGTIREWDVATLELARQLR